MAPSRREAVEVRFARRVAAALDARELDHDFVQRLRVARELAAARARHARAATAVAGGDGAAVLAGPPWWARVASLVPLLVLVAGLVLIEQRNREEQIRAAADIDAVLLADDLPPDAYGDAGFAEFLKQPPP
jgi:hypothetical protein